MSANIRLAEAGKNLGKVQSIERMMDDLETLLLNHRAIKGTPDPGYLKALEDMMACLTKYHFEPPTKEPYP